MSSSLLVAMPQLQDPNFKRTVMLLVHHDEEGTFGLVLNRSAEVRVDSLFESLELPWRGDPGANVHWGGPVATNTGWVLFDPEGSTALDAEDVTEVMDDLHFAGSLDVLKEVAVSPPRQVRLFLGYAGWGPGQLEEEMAEGAWLVAPASSEVVFDVSCDEMWDYVVRGIGIDPVTLISTRGVH